MVCDVQETATAITSYPPSSPPAFYARHPTAFIHDAFGLDLYDKQIEIADSVARLRRTAVYSCPSAGKTMLAALLTIWFWANFYPSKVITTAPSQRQVELQLWAQINAFIRSARRPIGGRCLTTILRNPKNDEHYALGFATRKNEERSATAQLAQGWHSPNLFVIIDEANAIDEHIMRTINRTLMTGSSARMLMIGNAISPAGFFYEVRRGNGPPFNQIVISAFDTPNIRANSTVIPGLVTQEWIDDLRREVPETDPLYRSLALAEFPEEDPQSLIPLSWVLAAEERWVEAENEAIQGPLITACDPARSEHGDSRAIIDRIAARVLNLDTRTGESTTETEGILRAKAAAGALIAIDPIGVGTGIYDHLREDGINVLGINFAAGTQERDHTSMYGFPNLRSLAWWRLREALDPNGQILLQLPPGNIKLRADLTTPRWKVLSNAKIQIEEKIHIRQRLGRSPDLGDALAISMLAGTNREIVVQQLEPEPLIPELERRLRNPLRHRSEGGVFTSFGLGSMSRLAGQYQKSNEENDAPD